MEFFHILVLLVPSSDFPAIWKENSLLGIGFKCMHINPHVVIRRILEDDGILQRLGHFLPLMK